MDDLIPTPKENWERIPVDPEGLAKLPPEEAEALLWLVGELEKGLNSGDPVPGDPVPEEEVYRRFGIPYEPV